ncbi:MAG: hypothetical protein FJ253_04770 [Phycisphaerae bacterium]|nr:hypothetical protein [Phycisphaerae bacterium]
MRIWKRVGVAALALCAALSVTDRTARADQEFGWTHWWFYVFGPEFDDFHATYSGTGGTIDREVLTVDTAGGGVIASNLNMIDIWWPDTWVTPGDKFEYTFNTAFPEVEFVGGSITKGGEIIGLVDTNGIIREPQNQITIGLLEYEFIPAPGAIVMLAAAGVVSRRRRTG